MLIKQRELEMRQEALNNPMTLKRIQKEIQDLKDAKKKKKHKKHKHRRSRSRSDSSTFRSEEDHKHHSKRNEKKHNSEYERLKQEAAALRNGRPAAKREDVKSELGPDMALYSGRLREIEE